METSGNVNSRRGPVHRDWPIKLSIASVVVVSMLILALGILSLGWMGARQTLLGTASKSARDAGLLITEKARLMLQPAQATLRQLTSTPLVEAKTLAARLKTIRTLSDVLVANSLISSVFVGYTDGSFFLVRPLERIAMREMFKPPPMSNFMAQYPPSPTFSFLPARSA